MPEAAVEFDWKEYCEGHDYPYANILGDTRNRSRRPRNRFNWFAALTLFAAVAAIMEAM